MEKILVFVGGVHGVGKTTLCKKLESETGFTHYSASDLIKKVKSEAVEEGKKAVRNIKGNQEILVVAIDKYLNETDTTILDGHFCLLDPEQKISKIPAETFIEISPSAIAVAFDAPENIREKINNRDGSNYDLELIRLFQSAEIEYSKEIAERLIIPHFLFDVSNDMTSFVKFIEDTRKGGSK